MTCSKSAAYFNCLLFGTTKRILINKFINKTNISRSSTVLKLWWWSGAEGELKHLHLYLLNTPQYIRC